MRFLLRGQRKHLLDPIERRPNKPSPRVPLHRYAIDSALPTGRLGRLHKDVGTPPRHGTLNEQDRLRNTHQEVAHLGIGHVVQVVAPQAAPEHHTETVASPGGPHLRQGGPRAAIRRGRRPAINRDRTLTVSAHPALTAHLNGHLASTMTSHPNSGSAPLRAVDRGPTRPRPNQNRGTARRTSVHADQSINKRYMTQGD